MTPAPRLLFCSVASYWDPGSGAAITTAELLELLAANGWACSVLCGSRVDAGAAETPGGRPNRSAAGEPLALKYLRDAGIPFQTTRYWAVDPVNRLDTTFEQHTYERNGVGVTVWIPDTIKNGGQGTVADGQSFLGTLGLTITKFRPDVVLTYGQSWVAKGIIRVAKQHRTKVVSALHHCEITDPDSFAGADAVWVASEAVREHYRAKFGVTATAVPNVIDPARVLCPQIDREHLTFVTPQPPKGVRWFSRVAAELARRRPDIKLLVVRGRSSEDWLHNGAVDLRGLSNWRCVPGTADPRAFYRHTRALLVPSLWQEAFGRVAVEALFNGIPVLASRRGGLPEVVGDAGFLFDIPEPYTRDHLLTPTAADVAPWLETIERLWDDEGFYQEAVARSRAAAERYRPQNVYARYEAFFRDVTGPRPT